MKLDRDIDSPARSHDGQPSRRRVLFVCHNHWALLAGGVESYVAGVYDTLRDSPEFEPFVLARAGQPYSRTDAQHPDAPLAMVGADPNQYLLYTDFSKFDYEFGRLSEKSVLTRSFADFLLALQPDVVHFHHTLYMGYDLVRITKNALPDTPIVYSLHEYIPICHRDGLMVRTINEELCQQESPRRCHECFPHISPQTFYMRKRFIQSHLSLVDHFIAPTDYVRSATWTGAFPPTRSRSSRRACCRSPTASPEQPRDAPPQPLRLLRAAQPLQGRRRPAATRWRSSAPTSTATSRSTGRTWTSRGRSSGSGSARCSRRSART